MTKTKFAALNVIRVDEAKKSHRLIASGEDGQPYFTFELSKEVAMEIAKKLDIQILTVKNQKQWQEEDAPEDAGVQGKDAAPQLNASTTLQEEV